MNVLRAGQLLSPARDFPRLFRDPRETFTVTLNRRKFVVTFCRMPSGRLGVTCAPKRRRDRKRPGLICVERRCAAWQTLEVTLHEGLHAFFGTRLSERVVERAGVDLMRLLKRTMHVRGWVDGRRKARRAA